MLPPRSRWTCGRFPWGSGLFLAVLLTAGSGCDVSTPQPAGSAGANAPPKFVPKEPTVELLFVYGSEKKAWLEAVTASFNAGNPRNAAGKAIHVSTRAMGSGEMISDLLEERVQAHLASPASAAFIELGNADSRARSNKPLVGDTKNLVLSPVVIAMWKPMAEALGWGKKPVGWAEVLEMAKSPKGWAQYDMPQWGRFTFGHTHPEYSNSGLIALFASVYAAAGKTKDLTLEDVARPDVGAFVGQIQQSVVHYGSSTGFFGDKMFAKGPGYLSAAVLYENQVIGSYDLPTPTAFPVVAIYPKEGTFWSDHPVGIVERPWVTDEHREAAEQYVRFLTDTPQQQRALEFGFRPADVRLKLGAPIDAAHGVDPKQPMTTLAVPPAPVMKAVIELWKQHKKNANLVLAIDVSGSMEEDHKIENARAGAEQLIRMLNDNDQLSLLPFNGVVGWAARNMSMKTDREKAIRAVQSLYASDGTALYDAVADAHRFLSENGTSDRIVAVVVLSDGADTSSRLNLDGLLRRLRAGREGQPIRVFTIGYGRDADQGVMKRIAEATEAKDFVGTPQNIREVFKEISTFF